MIYNLTDYTICAYFRVDEVYEELTRNGNFLWAFSNSEDIRSDALGYIICPLNNQRHSITLDGSGANQQTVSAGYAPLQGTWHHIAYVQDSELQTGTLYLDGVPVALGEITHLPKFALPREGKLELHTTGLAVHVIPVTLIFAIPWFTISEFMVRL